MHATCNILCRSCGSVWRCADFFNWQPVQDLQRILHIAAWFEQDSPQKWTFTFFLSFVKRSFWLKPSATEKTRILQRFVFTVCCCMQRKITTKTYRRLMYYVLLYIRILTVWHPSPIDGVRVSEFTVQSRAADVSQRVELRRPICAWLACGSFLWERWKPS